MSNEEREQIKINIRRALCEEDHLYFTRYFFKVRQNIKFKVNWHHVLIADALEEVIQGTTQNLIINVAPGSSKTEEAVINFISRGLAINPYARFLHLSGSTDLALLNSATARDMIETAEYQELWPLKIGVDTKSKKRWNIEIDGKVAGGVYATALAGQVVGFRAGHMSEGFQGAIIIDDPVKPDDAFSRTKLDVANRKLLTTVQSRKANENTPIVIIMQRIAENDVTGFVKNGNLPGEWKYLNIPALIDDEYVANLAPKYRALIEETERDEKGRRSYWPYKEPLAKLLQLERGEGTDAKGSRVSRHVFNSQYQQTPKALGGNLIKGEYFKTYRLSSPPKIKYRMIFADTAQKTEEHNDFSVFEEWGFCEDGRIYLLDLLKGKWESPELRKRAIGFWSKANGRDTSQYGYLRKFIVEDKSSGTDLVQSLKLPPYNIPIYAIQRNKDKYVRVNDALPYIELGLCVVPEDAPFTIDFISECEAFTADDSHDFDDQIDAMLDAVMELLSTNNKLKIWEQLAASH